MNRMLVVFLAMCISIAMVSCSAAGRFKRSHNPAGIPADLQKDGYVLLVVKADAGYIKKKNNRYVAKMMRRYYKGAYEIIEYNDLKSEKYANTDKYRYAILRDFGKGMNVQRSSSSGRTYNITYNEEYIKDRKNDTNLPSLGYPSPHYGMGIKGFVKYLKKYKK